MEKGIQLFAVQSLGASYSTVQRLRGRVVQVVARRNPIFRSIFLLEVAAGPVDHVVALHHWHEIAFVELILIVLSQLVFFIIFALFLG